MGCQTNFISCLHLPPAQQSQLKNALQTHRFTYANKINSQYALDEVSSEKKIHFQWHSKITFPVIMKEGHKQIRLHYSYLPHCIQSYTNARAFEAQHLLTVQNLYFFTILTMEFGCGVFLAMSNSLENVIINNLGSTFNFSKPLMLDNFIVSAFNKPQLSLAVMR